MKKLNLLWISPLLLANVALAGGQNAPTYSHAKPKHHHHQPAAFTGFSVMGAVGGVGLNLELEQSVVGFIPNNGSSTETLSSSPDVFAKNVAGLLGVGYGFQTAQGIFVGLYGTAGANYAEFEDTLLDQNGDTSSSLSSKIEAKLENDFAVVFKTGFVMNNRTLLYVLVGPRWGNFHTSLTGNATYNPNIVTLDTAVDRDSSEAYQLGFTVGAGITQALSDHFQAGIEYAFTSYGDLESLSVADAFFASDQSLEVAVNGNAELEAKTNTLMATLAYKF